MNTSNSIFLSFLLFTFSANIFLGTAQTVPDPMFDTASQLLCRSSNYYILSAESDNGGGLTLQIVRNGNCPYEIVLSLNKSANGLPLTFSPVYNDTIIRVNVDHNIRFINFSSPIVCHQSNVWQLVADGELSPLFFCYNHGSKIRLNGHRNEEL